MIQLIISSVAGGLLVEAAHTHELNLMTPICPQPVNECPRCTHAFHKGNLREHAQFKDMHV